MAPVRRPPGRTLDDLRPIEITPGVNRYAEGSCIFGMGHTRVLCTASVSEKVPRWMADSGRGWVTAEYRMLPRATHTRSRREGDRLKGRTSEIQRLIGRSLRAGVDLAALGPCQIEIDCDVLQADGGTRTASINGGFVALALALNTLVAKGQLARSPLVHLVGAVSLGLVGGEPHLDLDYEEDVAADVDLNVVMTGTGRVIEVQGTAEGEPFAREDLDRLLDLAGHGIADIARVMRQVPSVGELP